MSGVVPRFEEIMAEEVKESVWNNLDNRAQSVIYNQLNEGRNEAPVFYRKGNVFLKLNDFRRSIPYGTKGVDFGDFKLMLGGWLEIFQSAGGNYLLFPWDTWFGFPHGVGELNQRIDLVQKVDEGVYIVDNKKNILYFMKRYISDHKKIAAKMFPHLVLSMQGNGRSETWLVDANGNKYYPFGRTNFKIHPLVRHYLKMTE